MVFCLFVQTEKDTDWKSWLIVEKTLNSNYSSVVVPPMLQYLYPGCAVQAQYSEYHTVRVVLKGAARFVLISPQQSTKMHLYPYTHPKSRQSQVRRLCLSVVFVTTIVL